MRIYNDKAELIRNLKWRADTGLNRQYWGMEERGVRAPGSPRPRPGAPEPGGMQVLPGTYKVVLTRGKDSDSTMVTIKDDPRVKKSSDVIAAQRKAVERLRTSSAKLTEAMDRLSDWEEILGKMQGQLRGVDVKEVDTLRKTTNALQDSIKKIREYIVGKSNADKQGIVRGPQVTVMNRIQVAQQYIMSKSVAPGEQEQALVESAEQFIAEAVKRTNQFYATSWMNYRKLAEGTRPPLFKEYQPIQ